MLVNLTPHNIDIFSPNGEHLVSIPPSGDVARVSAFPVRVGTTDHHVSLFINRYGPVEGLPAPQLGVLYITSAMVRMATPRGDVASPGELKRGPDGKPIGCVGLVVNPT